MHMQHISESLGYVYLEKQTTSGAKVTSRLNKICN